MGKKSGLTGAWCRYLGYRIKAKGRHGTHSPFVYNFVEQVLRSSGDDQVAVIFRYLQQQDIVQQIRNWEDNMHLAGLPSATLFLVEAHVDLDKLLQSALPEKSGLLIMRPHSNVHRHASWEGLRQHSAIPLSIDAWRFGLLLRHDAFKQKQHFYLR